MDKKYTEISLLTNFQEIYGDWADRTFPKSTDKSRIGHIKLEVLELDENPDDPLEAADIVLLLLHHAHRHGYDLLTATREKFEIIKKRNWLPPNEDGICFHVKE